MARFFIAFIISLILMGVGATHAKERVSGPIQAEVVKVIDGDTITVTAHLWPGLHKTIKVRFYGVQSPELYRPKCDYERTMAKKAKSLIVHAIDNKPVQLINIQYGKYSDRVIAEVLNHNGKNLNDFLFENGLAKASKTGKRMDWCGDEN